MKIKINTEDGEKEIEMVIKGRVVNEVWRQLQKLEAGDESMEAVMEYKDYLDHLASELSGLSLEELNNLDIDEKVKITGAIVGKTKDSLDFTKSS